MSAISDGIGDIEQLDENLRKWFKEKWVRFGPDGKIRGACARGDDSEGKPKCLPQKKAQNLGKKGRKYAASKKRREDPNPERTGKAKNVATKKKTNEDIPFNECPKCRGPIVHESMMTEKQDACYHKVKSRYKVWPSAYASGALVQCRKKGASNWGTGGKKNESSIMKGIVNEEEYVLVLYIDGKPSAKYGSDQEAKKTMERLKLKFPNRKFELKREIRGGIGGNEKVGEAANPAQQAAIAINMKKRGEKPKNEASGTPGGVERFRSPAMVDLAMQQNLYKKDLEAVKAAKKKEQDADKPKPEYRQRGPVPSGEEQTLHIASTTIPSALVKDWIENRSVSTIVDFMSNRLANRQSTKMIDELKADPKFVNAVSKFFDIAGKSLEFRIKAKAANTTVNDSKFKVEAEDLRLSAFEAARGMTDVLLDYMKKYGVDKTGRRVPPGFNYHLEEARAKQYVKPYNDPQTGEQIGWVSSDGYHKKYWQMFAKNSAIKHAKLNPNEVQEDYTGEFAAEKIPAINPYGGLKDRQHRGAIGEALLSEMPTDNPTGASGEGGLRKYKLKPAGTFNKEELDEGVMQKIGAAAMAAALALGSTAVKAEPVYVYKAPTGDFKAVLSPTDIPANAMRRLVVDTENDDVAILGKDGSETPIKLDPSTVNSIKQQAGVGQAKSTQPQAAAQQSAAPKTYREKFGTGAVFKGKNVEKYGLTNTFNDPFSPGQDQETLLKNIKKIHDNRPAEIGEKVGSLEFIDSDNNKADKIARINYTNGRLDIYLLKGGAIGGYITARVSTGNKIKYVMMWADWTIGKPQEKKPMDFKEDTAYAGGMGQGGNAGQSYRKFKPKSAGTFKEEQLDEKCWDTHKQVGMKNKGGKSVPNCVPKESAIMKGINRLI
jgi:hypothetical protein